MKYLAWLERAHGYLLERSSADTPLFPSALPYPEVAGLSLGAKGRLESADWCRVFVNALVAWCNFVVLGCPDGAGSAYEPRVAHRSVEGIRPYADKLLGEVAEFFCPEMLSGTLSCEGKRKDLEDLVASGTGACYSGVVKVGCQQLSTALPVVAERVAIPEEAGQVDPRRCLERSRAEVVDRLPDLRLPEALWGEEVVACHRVAVHEESSLLRRLWAAKMITFVPEQELPRRRDGRLLLGGLFAVRKNEKEDRLIFDRRPENATMKRLDWAKLRVFAGWFLPRTRFFEARGTTCATIITPWRCLPSGSGSMALVAESTPSCWQRRVLMLRCHIELASECWVWGT